MKNRRSGLGKDTSRQHDRESCLAGHKGQAFLQDQASPTLGTIIAKNSTPLCLSAAIGSPEGSPQASRRDVLDAPIHRRHLQKRNLPRLSNGSCGNEFSGSVKFCPPRAFKKALGFRLIREIHHHHQCLPARLTPMNLASRRSEAQPDSCNEVWT